MIEDISTRISLSFVVPTILPDAGRIQVLLDSLCGFESEHLEVVLVNQSGIRLGLQLREPLGVQLVERLTDARIPAANARNYGASVASGEYLFFMDDDASLFSGQDALAKLCSDGFWGSDVWVPHLGQVVNGSYISHWPAGVKKLTRRNFPRVIHEWNLIIRRNIFSGLGGFPSNIGAGSPNAAQSGEAFVLGAKIVGAGLAVKLCPDIRVAHPSLYKSKPSIVVLGYSYGAGYATGLGIKSFDLWVKAYWIVRAISAPLFDIYLRPESEFIPSLDAVDKRRLRLALGRCRMVGFWDALAERPPRSLDWLNEQSMQLV